MNQAKENLRVYRIPYGDTAIPLRIPEGIAVRQAALRIKSEELSDPSHYLEEVCAAGPRGASLAEWVAGMHLAVLLEDATRALDYRPIFTALRPFLRSAKKITSIVSTGTHDPRHPGNETILSLLKEIWGEKDPLPYQAHVHDCRRADFLNLGVTQRGTPILANRLVEKADLFLVLSDMKNHYFAGYSNPLKHFLPGICAYESVEKNHSLALNPESTFGRHPWHPDPARRANPLAEDMLEVYQAVAANRPVLALVMVHHQKKLRWAVLEEIAAATRAGIEKVDEWMGATLLPADLLIVSPGNYPEDGTIYTAQRALELSRNGVKAGGSILFFAECRDGIGPASARENFLDWLVQPPRQVLERLQKQYVLYSHKAYKFAELMLKTRQIFVTTGLPKAELEKIHLIKAEDPQAIVDGLVRENPDLTVNIVTDGNKIALF
ncbi:MAG: nickel-dependent lactate racemase [Calditrichia bacterium]